MPRLNSHSSSDKSAAPGVGSKKPTTKTSAGQLEPDHGTVELSRASNPLAYGVLGYCNHLKRVFGKKVPVRWGDATKYPACILDAKNVTVRHIPSVYRYILHNYESQQDGITLTLTGFFVDASSQISEATDFPALLRLLNGLDAVLESRSFLADTVGLGVADFAVWGALRSAGPFQGLLKKNQVPKSVLRWYRTVAAHPDVSLALSEFKAQQASHNKSKKDQGSFEVALKDAEVGKVVTRFPPEPSGFLHIGHVKAALLNAHFAEKYDGSLLVRFDDTNPSKEKSDFERAILEDLNLLKIKPSKVSHTSDHFPKLLDYAEKLIRDGKAYADDTGRETMKHERMEGLASKRRNASVEENLQRWEEMKNGSELGVKFCLRAKMSVDDKNKAMRDPVIYRCNIVDSHHQTGTRYKVYPTYDFACPCVDSLEGVSHALRTNEYHDRIPQYAWFIEKLGLRKVHVWEYGRLNFVYTLLSKRKLQWFVDENRVLGWDDPRFATVRGILRRGITVNALKQYILSQGASTAAINLEWDKLWATNKKLLDPETPRHTALDEADMVSVTVEGGPTAVEFKDIPFHKKNPRLGTKKTAYGPEIYLSRDDVVDSYTNEEVTLMDWGNFIITTMHKGDDGRIISLVGRLHLEGDFKKTKKKLTWLINAKNENLTTKLQIRDFDYLITKPKIEEGEDFKEFLTPVTEYKKPAIGDAHLSKLQKGQHIQLERRGYFVCDGHDGDVVILNHVPDGRLGSVASKHDTGGSKSKEAKNDRRVNGVGGKQTSSTKLMDGVIREHAEKVKMFKGGDGVKIDTESVCTRGVTMFSTRVT